jgi:hypothetical protein
MPELIDLLIGQDAFPGRHLVLSVVHRIVESRPLVCVQPAQVEGGIPGMDQVVAVTSGATVSVDSCACIDFGLVARVIGPGASHKT